MNATQLFEPHPILQPLIKMVLVKGVVPWEDDSIKIYSYPPTPVHCIIFYLGSPISARKFGEDTFERQPDCVVVGPQLTPVEIELSKDHRAVMIGFQPGGLFRFLGIPMTEIFDDGIDGFQILDKEISNLIDELREIEQPEEVNARVQMYLLKKMQSTRDILPFDRALRKLQKAGNLYTMDDIARDACLSLRQFQRKCHERLGMNPKLYARIARFSKAYSMFEANQQLTWSHISHQCGYFDQMHFIKDFKEFTGVTPGLMSKKLDDSGLTFQAPMKIG
ncbi:AraC family transcriptional regulator [Rhodohalobacter sp.]|uniref:helix-turn-helix domain-containing protein n=1 Tax=Rhodohalobacter sp. TaxID=1974210 RepID=UPI002ACEE01D|nr:AraC family transcriptional regulator [Rhodohalobacter sp.]MDZ7757759.1 AraC family transcriptional regulator [Rhodohalobacter sp.]